MDRQAAHDFAAMAFAQQQANIQQQHQFGYHPPHQQQFVPPFHHPPHRFPPPHIIHHQPQQLPPYPHHMPSSHIVPVPPPSDPELHKRIDKLIEYSAKNGPEFEAMIREKQKDNPAYSFLFGGEGHNYYRHNLWLFTHPFSPTPFHPAPNQNPNLNLNPNPMLNLNPLPILNPPQMHPPFQPFFDHHPHHPRPFYDNVERPFKGLSGPLPNDVAIELSNVLNNLTGTKESIKGAKIWFMQRSPFAPALAEALRDRFFTLDDSDRQLHIIYLINDILFESLQRRINPSDLDNESLAFKPIIGTLLARVYHNPQNREENQSRLQQILQFWAVKEVYDHDTICGLQSEMIGGQTPISFLGAASGDHPIVTGLPHPPVPIVLDHEQPDGQVSLPTGHQFLHNQSIPGGFTGPVLPSPVQPSNMSSNEKIAPYPLFPPGLIPEMVRKMQIGSGVPYSPLSPLDIPTSIPLSNVSPSQVLDRVSKFFKEIGEVNPSEGPVGPDDGHDGQDYERESPVRKGGACIPPPPNLQVEVEENVDAKTISSGSGRLGLGATEDPDDGSQYDDVYGSYRKHRSSTYHTFMSTRATTK